MTENHYTYFISDFREALQNCVDRLRRHDETHARWFASKLTEFDKISYPAYQGGCEQREEVRLFRLAEIAAERKKLSEQDAALEAEARTLTTEKDK